MPGNFKRQSLILGCIVLLSGCIFSSGPTNNEDFARLEKLDDLVGTYSNIGEGESEESVIYLSSIIWPKERGWPHDGSITTIEVSTVSDKVLRIRATGKSVITKEKLFTEGKDFEFLDGRIRLKPNFTMMAGPTIGPYYDFVELGLERGGHGKFRYTSVAAILIYSFFPAAGAGEDDVRFRRLGGTR